MEWYVIKNGDFPVVVEKFKDKEEAEQFQTHVSKLYPFYIFYVRSEQDVIENGNFL